MSRLLQLCQLSAVMLALCLLASPHPCSADDKDDAADIKEAQKATEKLKKLTDAIAEGKEKEIADLKKALNDTTDLKHIMWAAYKPQAKGGLGANPKPDSSTGMGIERKLDLISQKGLPQTQVTRESADLIRMAHVVQAIAEIAEMNTPKMDEPKKPVADWKKFNKEQKEAAQDLIDAVKANNAGQVRTAATRLYGSCTSCHGVFRN
jgi:cytochrome c556